MTKKRILVLGAGFGGMELCTMLSEAFGDAIDVTLIDKNDSFYFGFSKLDVMFGRATPEAVRLPYRKFVKPGVRVLQETIASIDPIAGVKRRQRVERPGAGKARYSEAARTAYRGECTGQHDLAIGLNGDSINYAVRACSRIESRIQSAVRIEPRDAAEHRPLYLGERAAHQDFAISLQRYGIDFAILYARAGIETGVKRAIRI